MDPQHALADRQHHDIVAPHYDRLVVDSRRVLNDRVFGQLGCALPRRGARMLDLGAGTGQMTVRFGPRFEEAVLVDHSEGMLDEARRNTGSLATKIELQRSDALDYVSGTSQRFDLITSVGFLHHLEAPELVSMLRSVRQALAPNGLVVIAEPVRTDHAEPRPVRIWNRPGLVRLRQYLDLAPFPDEAPLDLAVLKRAIDEAGLVPIYERRAWELLARYGGNAIDRIAIALLDRLYGATGVIWFAVLKAASPDDADPPRATASAAAR